MLNTVQLTLSPETINDIYKGKASGGGFQSAMKQVRACLKGNVLTIDGVLIEKIHHYATGGTGGYQKRFEALLREIRTANLIFLLQPVSS